MRNTHIMDQLLSLNEADKRKYMQLNVYDKAKAGDKLTANWHNDKYWQTEDDLKCRTICKLEISSHFRSLEETYSKQWTFRKVYWLQIALKTKLIYQNTCYVLDLLNDLSYLCTVTYLLVIYTHNRFMALWILFQTTWVSQYQKKHSPTHIYHGHQSSLICFIHLIWSMTSSLFNLHAWWSFFTISPQVFFGLPLGLAPSTSYSIHSSCNHCLLFTAQYRVSGWMFLLVSAHQGCPAQNPESWKMVVVVIIISKFWQHN